MTDLPDRQPPAEPAAPRSPHAQLTNLALAYQTLNEGMSAGDGSPRLGLFYGPSGYGKSVAAAFVGSRTGAVYIAAKSIWTQRSLLEAIAIELGISRLARTGPALLQQIIDRLLYDPRPIIIDEMDHLVRKQSVEIIRDIHDATSVAILMIGEEALPLKLKEWERFDNRILVATPAQPASVDDAKKLRDFYCTRVSIADDLVELFTTRCKGVTRRVVVNLQAAQRHALAAGQFSIDLAWWGDRPVQTGDVAARRRA